MVASRADNSNPARIPALGVRLVALLILSIILMVLDHRQNHLDTVRKAIGAAVYPLQVIVDAPFRLWAWVQEGTTSRNELQLELGRLKAERLLTNARLQRMTALEAENARLRDLLDARTQVRDEARVAEIMAVDANPYRHSIVLDIGQGEGAYDGQAIVDAAGVIGQIIEAGVATSQAMLISDPSHSLPVEVNRSGLRTIANGTGDFGRLDLPFITNNADIRPGDLLVTSGLGGTFPAGYPVAIVETVVRIPQEPFADVTARPAALLDQVREVMLIWKEEQPGEQELPDE
ncbi:MAG: rod shape-determining protein MreC [Woeseiaceae bacterium]|nr:rod shape-determining protein MreC [Woeseiaceae bacterium]